MIGYICSALPIRVQCKWGRYREQGTTKARRKTRRTINKTRGFLHELAKLLGDFQAARKGRIGKRIAHRAAGRGTGKALGKIFK